MRRLPWPALPARLVAALVVLATAAAPIGAQSPPPEPPPAPTPAAAPESQPKATYTTRRSTAPIVVDASLDEPAWQDPPTFTLDYETYPADNLPPPVRTEFWVTYDERNLYVAVRAHDPKPADIRARLRDRDNAFRDDFVGIVLDTFNDERRAFEFFVNPLGVQMDLFQNESAAAKTSRGTRSGRPPAGSPRPATRWRWQSLSRRCGSRARADR